MNATTIKSEIKKLSGYKFPVFQKRARSLAFDCALVMQDIKAKYGRLITCDFLQKELGLNQRFGDYYKSVRRNKIADYDPGFTMNYMLELHKKDKGLTWLPNAKRWWARITVNGEQKHLGYFANKADAIEAYNQAKKDND